MNAVEINGNITVAELANKMDVKASAIIKLLLALGHTVTLNQMLDKELAEQMVKAVIMLMAKREKDPREVPQPIPEIVSKTYAQFFGEILRQELIKRDIGHEKLEDLLRQYFYKKYPNDTVRANHNAQLIYRRYYDENLEYHQVFELVTAVNLKLIVSAVPLHYQSKEEVGIDIPSIWNESIDVLDLPVRITNCLKLHTPAVEYIGELVSMHRNEPIKIVGIGRNAHAQLLAAMKKHGLVFGTNTTGWEAPTK